jgi:biopolymer transport protein ExbB/biopolymer transport protein TolQ
MLLKVALLGSSWVMYALLLSSVFSISTIVERWWFFRRQNEDANDLGDRVCDRLDADDEFGALEQLSASKTIEAAVLARAFRRIHGGPNAFSDAVEGELGRKRKELERGMNLLGTLGNNAPFIGLLGTVIGVIEAFSHLGGGQDKASMSAVMGGIAEALVATGVGLFVAIPAVVAFNVFQRKVAEVEESVMALSKQICATLKSMHTVGPRLVAVAHAEARPLPSSGDSPAARAATMDIAG